MLWGKLEAWEIRGSNKEAGVERLCWEQKGHGFGAFQCLRHSSSALVNTAWLYFPLSSAGVCFRNGQSQFSTSDSIVTPEQEGNSFWEPPRNLRIPQQARGSRGCPAPLGAAVIPAAFCGALCHAHKQAGKGVPAVPLSVLQNPCVENASEIIRFIFFFFFSERLYPFVHLLVISPGITQPECPSWRVFYHLPWCTGRRHRTKSWCSFSGKTPLWGSFLSVQLVCPIFLLSQQKTWYNW